MNEATVWLAANPWAFLVGFAASVAVLAAVKWSERRAER